MNKIYYAAIILILSLSSKLLYPQFPLIKTIKVNNTGVTSVGFSRSGMKLICSSADGNIYIVNTLSSKTEKVIILEEKAIMVSSCCNREYFAILSKRFLTVYSWKDYKMLYKYKQKYQRTFFTFMDISEKGRFVAVSSKSSEGYFDVITVINHDKKKPQWILKDNKSILSLSFLDTSLLLAGEEKGYVKLWDIRHKRKFSEYFAKVTSYKKILSSSNKNYIIALNIKGKMLFWDRYSKELLRESPGMGYSAFSFSPDAEYLIVAKSTQINIYSIYERRLAKIILSHEHEITDIHFHRIKSIFVTSSLDGSIKLWKWQP
jgi:WD40 repeat protein